MRKKPILLFFLLIVGISLFLGIRHHNLWKKPNVQKDGKLYIPTNASFTQVLDSIAPFLEDKKSFEKAAIKEGFPQKIRSGRFSLETSTNNQDLLKKLISGKQDEIAIRIGNYTSIQQLAGRISPFLEADSSEIVKAVIDAELSKDYQLPQLIYFFIPNTYNFHWNTSGEGFVARMTQEYEKFWNEEREQKLKNQDLSKFEIISLASIVQLESAIPEEQPTVAGAYLNRLRIGMKLDADPTVIYALKLENPDLNIQRVYYRHLRIDSPYNTYRNPGIPPGPICMPNPSAIDAVLNPEDHNYIFFVADPSRPGWHLFAKNLTEHEKNARIYRQWLNDQNIN